MEGLPFAKPSQVRTDALNTLILATSMFLSNEGASKVLSLPGVQASNDTVQRLYNRIEFMDNPDAEEIGIDDVAIRKGQAYATAIYGLRDHHLIALLDGRDGEPLKNGWNRIIKYGLLQGTGQAHMLLRSAGYSLAASKWQTVSIYCKTFPDI